VKITVASGKGGTGKTTIATSLALSLATASPGAAPPLFWDCDVEAPNAHLFLHPNLVQESEVSVPIPRVDAAKCTHCGRCAEVCPWHAIAVVGKKVLVFPQLCHGCGSCTVNCPEGAIIEVPNPIGRIQSGPARSGIPFTRGVLNVGEPMAVPIIRELKRGSQSEARGRTVIIDASPGTTCPVVESMRGSDYVLLVTEPTPFGLHDLRLAVQVTEELKIPAGVIINRDGVGDSGVEAFCRQVGLPVLMRIPLDERLARGIARGQTLVDVYPAYVPHLQDLYHRIVELVGGFSRRVTVGTRRVTATVTESAAGPRS
jgi:MinD superfamily P-loop ATPase